MKVLKVLKNNIAPLINKKITPGEVRKSGDKIDARRVYHTKLNNKKL